jgi:glycosyltransferase involved in cell wall biosynthesis
LLTILRVLLLTQVLPYPPDSGPKVKTWNVLKFLAQHHQVTLISFVRGDQSEEITHLKQYCHAVYTVPIERGAGRDLWYMARSMLSGLPFLMVRDDRPAMRDVIDKVADETGFDIVHADQLNMAQYAARVNSATKILDAHNALWLLYKRLWQTMPNGPKKWLLNRDWQLLKTYEGDICRQFDAVLAVSQEDKTALEQAVGQPLNNVTIIPIAIDTDEVEAVERLPQANHILHIGTMFWPPNVDGILWFLQEVWPIIHQQRPDVVFDVVGARPPAEIEAYGQESEAINVTGYVDDPSDFYRQAGVMIVPLRAGGGMRVKILNALAQALPLVSTTIGCEGIAVEHGKHLLVADTPAAFAEATLRLLDDHLLAKTLGRNGRQLIEDQYDYRTACLPLNTSYQSKQST